MHPQKTGSFRVAFTALTDGDDLGCSKPIAVSWEKPNAADVATIRLYCDCSQHIGREVAHYDTPTTTASDAYTFTLTHTSVLNETGRKLRVTIEDGTPTVQNSDPRIDMYAQCPPVAHGGDAKHHDKGSEKVATASGDPIKIDAPDDQVIQLRRGHDKTLNGRFDRAFGKRIMVFVYKKVSARQVLRLAKLVHIPWFSSTWRVELPQSLWAGTDVLEVRLAFISSKGIVGNGTTWPTEVT